jgi:hypothetical protein
MKRCKLCKELKVREVNGIAISKFCSACKKVKELELREKNNAKKEKLKEEKLAKAQRKLEKKLSTKKYQKSKFKSLHKKAWGLVSLYVRKRHADWNGMTVCYTCGVMEHYTKMNAGHFHHNKLDFDPERNLRTQCVQCNLHKSGNLAIYGTKLAFELGLKGMEQLRLDANTTTYTIEDLENIIEKYKT